MVENAINQSDLAKGPSVEHERVHGESSVGDGSIRSASGTESSNNRDFESAREAGGKAHEAQQERDIAKIKEELLSADKAMREHDEKTGTESDWPSFYAKFIADKRGGISQDEQQKLEDAFRNAGKAHHQFEIDTGVEDKDWADWYARFVHKQISVQNGTEAPNLTITE